MNPACAPDGWNFSEKKTQYANERLEKKSRGYRDWLTEKIKKFNTENGQDINKSKLNQSEVVANSANFAQSAITRPYIASFA